MAHVRQSRPEYGLGFEVKILQTIEGVASSQAWCPFEWSVELFQESVWISIGPTMRESCYIVYQDICFILWRKNPLGIDGDQGPPRPIEARKVRNLNAG
jgi:hypothetical protein